MNMWKRVGILAMSLLLMALLAACGGGGSSAASAGSTPTTAAPTSAPTTAAPQKTGACTTMDNCQNIVVTVTPSQVKRGGKVTVTVKGFVANTQVGAYAGGQRENSDAVTVMSDAQGNFSVTLTLLPDADLGPLDIQVFADSGIYAGDHTIVVAISNKLTII